MSTLGTLLSLVGATLLVSTSALAQFSGNGRDDRSLPREGACFYQDAHFQGASFCVETGQDLESLPWSTNDRVSSIRLIGDAEVMVYQDYRYAGIARRFTHDVQDLASVGFNDQISSVQTRSLASAGTTGQSWGLGTGTASLPQNGACFYESSYYQGPSFCVEAGANPVDVPAEANDRISSVRILGSASVTVYDQLRSSGDSRYFTTSVQDLQSEGFGDRISSVEVRGDSYGGGLSSQGAGYNEPDAIVRRAYQDILGREPDSEGLRTYRSYIIDNGWTEQQVRDALRKSAEYAQRGQMTPARAQDVVRRAYLAVFNREPDPASRAYVDHVLRDGWSQQDVERALRNSAEYRNRR
jgi:hypothetical protein